MKQRRITTGEYTYGLPLLLFLRELIKELRDDDQSMILIKYKILIRIDDELQYASLLVSICFKQNIILYKTSFIRLEL